MKEFKNTPPSQESKEKEPTVEVEKSLIEAAIVEKFIHELMVRKALEIKHDKGEELDTRIDTSPNQSVKLPSGEILNFQVYPKDLLEYVRGTISFDELMDGREFSVTKELKTSEGETWKVEYEPVKVKFTGAGSLEKKLNMPSWKEELKRSGYKGSSSGLESMGIEPDTIL